jgi:hypothetical protein
MQLKFYLTVLKIFIEKVLEQQQKKNKQSWVEKYL